jgi:cbb3-type cytochrome oxidase subunit 1
MKDLGRTYFCVALSLLIIGMVQGFWMGATNALQYRDAHVGLLLPGFVTLSIYGAIYRLWPRLETSRLAKVQFWAATLGAPLLVLGSLPQVLASTILVVSIGASLAIAGAGLMFYLFATRAETS